MNSKEIEQAVYNGLLDENYDHEDFSKYLAFVLAIRDMYQSFHWGTSGRDSFEDHLLFERLYNAMSEEADAVAEKFVGLLRPTIADPSALSRSRCDVYDNLMEGFDISSGGNDLVVRAIFLEQAFLKVSEHFYDKLDDSNQLTLGLDDMLASIYSKHEENIYFLKQKIIVDHIGQND